MHIAHCSRDHEGYNAARPDAEPIALSVGVMALGFTTDPLYRYPSGPLFPKH